MTTLETRRRPDVEPRIQSANTHCANNHLWTPETTRWRLRSRLDRGDKSYQAWERDCLLCKAVSEGRRKKRRAVERRWV